jgi:hypothetical protein
MRRKPWLLDVIWPVATRIKTITAAAMSAPINNGVLDFRVLDFSAIGSGVGLSDIGLSDMAFLLFSCLKNDQVSEGVPRPRPLGRF